MAIQYSNSELQKLTGLSARQMIYLAEHDVVVPEYGEADGRGTTRWYSRRNAVQLLLLKQLCDVGMDYEAMRLIGRLAFVCFSDAVLDQIVEETRESDRLAASAPRFTVIDKKIGFLHRGDMEPLTRVFQIKGGDKVGLCEQSDAALTAGATVIVTTNLAAMLTKLREFDDRRTRAGDKKREKAMQLYVDEETYNIISGPGGPKRGGATKSASARPKVSSD